MIRDGADYAARMDYIHFNPVEHGLVAQPADWALSTLRRCVAGRCSPTPDLHCGLKGIQYQMLDDEALQEAHDD